MRWRDLTGTAMALCLIAATPGAAQDYTCAPWQADGAETLERISILRSLAIVTTGGRDETVRMARGQLNLRIYPDESSVYIVHGDPVQTDNGPAFGPKIRVQRLIHDPVQPQILQTECEAVK